MEQKALALMAVALFSLTLGCGGGETASRTPAAEPEKRLDEPPSAEVAAALIANSPEFSEYKFTRAAYSLPMQARMLKGSALESAEDLASAGWILVDPSGNLVLAGKSVGDKRFIPRENGSLDIVPLARKEFISVGETGHDPDGDVTVDFTWRWVPNEVAAAFKRGAIATRFEGEQKARATIYRSRAGGWNVMRIVEIEPDEPATTESTGT